MISMSMLGIIPNEYSSDSSDPVLTEAQEEVLYTHSSTSHWEYDSSAGGGWSDWASAIALDSEGNAYITGSFVSPIIEFGNIVLNNSGVMPSLGMNNSSYSNYDFDVFVAKLDPVGNWVWAIKADGFGVEDAYGIAVDQSGFVYVTGDFSPISDGNGGQIGPSFGQNQLTSAGSYDGFVARVSPGGQWLWALSYGSICIDSIRDIDVGSNGDVYFTGLVGFAGDDGCGAGMLGGSGDNAIIGKLNPAAPYGQILWVVESDCAGCHAPGPGYVPVYDRGNGVSVDDNGNAFITGIKNRNTTFGGLGANSSAVSYNGGFTAKIDATGSVEWVNHGKGGNDVVVGPGSVYVVGNGQYGVGWVQSLDEQNGNWQWTSETGCGSPSAGTPTCPTKLDAVEIDGNGDIYVAGSFSTIGVNSWPVWLEVGSAIHQLPSGSTEGLLIAQLKPNGNWNWSIGHGECGNYGLSNCGGDIRPLGIAINNTEEIYIAGHFDHESITLEDGMANYGAHMGNGYVIPGAGGQLDAFAAKYIRCPPGDVAVPNNAEMKTPPVQGGNVSESLCGTPPTNPPVNQGNPPNPPPSLPFGGVPLSSNTPSGGGGCDNIIQGNQGFGDSNHPIDNNTFYWDSVSSSWQAAHIVSFENGWETVGWSGLQSGLPWNSNGWSWIAPDGDSANLAVNSPNNVTFAQTLQVPAEAYNIRVNYRAFADDFVSKVDVHSVGFTQNSDISMHSSSSGDNRALMIWGNTHWPGQSPMGNPWPSATPLPIYWTPSSNPTPVTIAFEVTDTVAESSEVSGGLAFHWMIQYCLNDVQEPEEVPPFFETSWIFNCPSPYYHSGTGATSQAGDTQVRSNTAVNWELAVGVSQAPHWTTMSSAASGTLQPTVNSEWIWMDDPNVVTDNYVWLIHGFPIPTPTSGNTQFTGGYANLHFAADQTIVSAKIVDSGMMDLSQGGFSIPAFASGNSHLADQVYSSTVTLDSTATYQAGDYLYILILAEDWTDGHTYLDGNTTQGIDFTVETCFTHETVIGQLPQDLEPADTTIPGFGAVIAIVGLLAATLITAIRKKNHD